MQAEWSCYRGGDFNGRRMVMFWRWPVLKEGEWLCYRGSQFNGERMIMLERQPV